MRPAHSIPSGLSARCGHRPDRERLGVANSLLSRSDPTGCISRDQRPPARKSRFASSAASSPWRCACRVCRRCLNPSARSGPDQSGPGAGFYESDRPAAGSTSLLAANRSHPPHSLPPALVGSTDHSYPKEHRRAEDDSIRNKREKCPGQEEPEQPADDEAAK